MLYCLLGLWCRCNDAELDVVGLPIVRSCAALAKGCSMKGEDPGKSRAVTEEMLLFNPAFLILLN